VLARCWAALYPRANFLDVLDGNPDLYGPFWIATTVVFILFVGGTVSQYLVEKGGDGGFRYDFRLLSGMSFISLPSYSVLLLLSTSGQETSDAGHPESNAKQAPPASSTATQPSSP
jgi:hypothetical protein